MSKELSKEELARYSRHIIIPEIGLDGQSKLKGAKVLVVGAGGLGSPVLLYLAAAGVGTIGIVDYDVVDDSNLQRQVLYSVEDVGKSKVDIAAAKIKSLNPHIQVHTYKVKLDSDNAEEIVTEYDIVADGSDNFATRYLVNDACVLFDKVNVYASIFRFEGQVSVFNYKNSEGEVGPNYRDIFPEPPPPGLVPSCSEAGVLGVLPGIVGSMQANEVIKIITDVGEVLSGVLVLMDAASLHLRRLKIERDPDNPLNGNNPSIDALIDYEQFCNSVSHQESSSVKEVNVHDLKRMKDAEEDFQLIDVREPYEYNIVHLDGELIPLGEIENNLGKITRDKKVVVHCRSGKRSEKVIRLLEKQGFDNLYNLKGGILAYAEEVDTKLTKY